MITEEELTRWSEIVEANPGMYPNALLRLIEEVRQLRAALESILPTELSTGELASWDYADIFRVAREALGGDE